MFFFSPIIDQKKRIIKVLSIILVLYLLITLYNKKFAFGSAYYANSSSVCLIKSITVDFN